MKSVMIGAGPCGLAMVKALKEAKIDYDQIEADPDVGGNWLHGVSKTVYTDTCKDVMQYTGFPSIGHVYIQTTRDYSLWPGNR